MQIRTSTSATPDNAAEYSVMFGDERGNGRVGQLIKELLGVVGPLPRSLLERLQLEGLSQIRDLSS